MECLTELRKRFEAVVNLTTPSLRAEPSAAREKDRKEERSAALT